jgi:DNA-3-methyladenine glycosylase
MRLNLRKGPDASWRSGCAPRRPEAFWIRFAHRVTGPLLGAGFFARSVHSVAPDLIGCELLVDGVGGVVVECEAYARDDPASHAFAGPTRRNASMFGPLAHAYVYRSYGVHWMLNLVCGPQPGVGEAVLVRALRPTHGPDAMRARRGLDDERLLCAGPGRLAEALAIGPDLDGATLLGGRIELRPRVQEVEIVRGVRVGITKGVEQPWRYALAGSVYVSRPRPWPRTATARRPA